jgi:hypothetical protein
VKGITQIFFKSFSKNLIMTITIKTVSLLFAMSLALSSSNGQSNTSETAETTEKRAKFTQMLITSQGFRWLVLGDPISKHKNYVKKSEISTGEGDFDVYDIKDFENQPAGYFVASKNKLSVGDITVETSKARTEEGIKVGDTFKDLLKVFPNIEVHGSETEARTYATVGNISYRLDMANTAYEVEKKRIPASTKITQIVISTTFAPNLTVKYAAIKPYDYCWQTTKVVELHRQPSSDSKVEGKHFAGEVLGVLETKTVNNQLWIRVKYNFKIKAGYEDQFADGQVSPSGGAVIGWIGGAETPKISCK